MDNDTFLKTIYESMPNGLSPIEKARYLYLKLGSFLSYSPDVFYGTNQELEKLFLNGIVENNTNGKSVGVCTDMNKRFVSLYEMASIKSKVFVDRSDYKNDLCKRLSIFHSYVTFEIGGFDFSADIAEDLMRIHMGGKTKYFASQKSHSPTILSEEQLRQIDSRIGYINEDIGYTDEQWDKLSEAIQNANMTKVQKINFILRYIKLGTNFSRMGHLEKHNMCRSIFKNILGLNYKNTVNFSVLKGTYSKGEANYVPLIWALDNTKENLNQPVYFLYDPKQDCYIQYSLEQIKKHIKENGYTLPPKANKVPKLFGKGKEK